jgi:hypothetical protein
VQLILGRFPSVMVITADSDSANLGSIPRETYTSLFLVIFQTSYLLAYFMAKRINMVKG